jgi:hypothetical protein
LNGLALGLAWNYSYYMILQYHLSQSVNKKDTIDIDTLEEFLEWLVSLGIGGDNPSKKSVEEFSEAYCDMSTTGKARILFAKPFDETQPVLTIDKVEL